MNTPILKRTACCLLTTGLTLSASLGIVSCGYKTNPVQPQQIVPKAVTDLRYQLGSDGATLHWTFPRETVTGKDLGSIGNFKLYRAVVPVEDYCESCPIPFVSPISLDGGALPDKGTRTGTYNEPVLRPGNLYFYKVRCSNGWLSESADSNVVSFLWDTPAAAPAGLTVRPARGGNQLTWAAVTLNQDGSAVGHPVRYQVFRKTGEGALTKLGEPVSGTSFTDTAVQNGVNYTYQVQALSSFREGLVQGGTSQTVSATPHDRQAPPAPTTPQALITDAGIKVFWHHSQADDLTGYRVYRRVADGSPQMVGQVNLPYNMFIDKSAPKGAALFYSVTSVDGENPPNESKRTAEVQAEE